MKADPNHTTAALQLASATDAPGSRPKAASVATDDLAKGRAKRDLVRWIEARGALLFADAIENGAPVPTVADLCTIPLDPGVRKLRRYPETLDAWQTWSQSAFQWFGIAELMLRNAEEVQAGHMAEMLTECPDALFEMFDGLESQRRRWSAGADILRAACARMLLPIAQAAMKEGQP